ncbi:DUF308 domain-containing protein [Anaerosalibacter bizertensis]|uniref:DUF308 domain-containing protein n=1 Tax=Anaerosalibacter bizertensis TaxID=932217 RepID=A0A9Q4FMG1_9FIRM|nr:DUF308 domain-containing protein [Anaerosalibacter bizertensis]MBV1820642.1 DUF308 domain-containing protein [Bacteroidales bacterium MSK.15.36]MCB5560435.1 DUF308 domain-containing protein [Anaerosalibacter bizertensis]MCG4565689.1 DUF308 domain-containing protein [Anaerosalibacter bizertensis]MCG4583326.1 DUF308 domain-containing protein [Anaerosalibacter bizertensis]
MIEKNENGFSWGSLLMSILFFIAAWKAFRSPIEILMTLGIFFGVIAIVQGFLSIIFYPAFRRIFQLNPWPVIVIGIFYLLIGLHLIMEPSISLTLLPIIFASWFIIDSIRNIMIAFRLRKIDKRWFWINFILGILGMFIGIFLISNLYVAVISISSLIALYFLVGGVIRLIDTFV